MNNAKPNSLSPVCAFSYNSFKQKKQIFESNCNNGDNTDNNTDDIKKQNSMDCEHNFQ